MGGPVQRRAAVQDGPQEAAGGTKGGDSGRPAPATLLGRLAKFGRAGGSTQGRKGEARQSRIAKDVRRGKASTAHRDPFAGYGPEVYGRLTIPPSIPEYSDEESYEDEEEGSAGC
mmetsp:Transcript_142751/g.397637  ORF Transcript_142751/g.397637 Transcript_142751/m.397637 type:complete len:115 (-) Transcript_142751:188-532(-)